MHDLNVQHQVGSTTKTEDHLWTKCFFTIKFFISEAPSAWASILAAFYIIDENWTIFVTKKTKTHLDTIPMVARLIPWCAQFYWGGIVSLPTYRTESFGLPRILLNILELRFQLPIWRPSKDYGQESKDWTEGRKSKSTASTGKAKIKNKWKSAQELLAKKFLLKAGQFKSGRDHFRRKRE